MVIDMYGKNYAQTNTIEEISGNRAWCGPKDKTGDLIAIVATCISNHQSKWKNCLWISRIKGWGLISKLGYLEGLSAVRAIYRFQCGVIAPMLNMVFDVAL